MAFFDSKTCRVLLFILTLKSSTNNKEKMRKVKIIRLQKTLTLFAILLLTTQSAVAQFDADKWWLADEPLLGFVAIPAGSFPMGSNPLIDPMAFENERWSDSRRQGIVEVPLFYISRYETTIAQFKEFVEDTQHNVSDASLEGAANFPVASVTWTDAVSYARWLDGKLRGANDLPIEIKRFLDEGGRVTLASEAEWEKAAKGEQGSIYPWGNQVQQGMANYANDGVLAVGSFDCSECKFDLADMSGNVWEWTRSPYQDYPFDDTDDREDLASDALWVMRGGSYSDEANNIRASVRGAADPGARRPFIGFRVVISKQ